MFSMAPWFHKQARLPQEKPVKLTIINAIELKDNADYILVADSRHVTKEDMRDLVVSVQKVGFRNVVGFILNGTTDGKASVEVIERPRTTRANNGRFAKKGNTHATNPSRNQHP